MGKPSIFSRNYERQMKKRKKRRIIGCCITVVVILGGIFAVRSNSSKISEKFKEIKNKYTYDKVETTNLSSDTLNKKDNENKQINSDKSNDKSVSNVEKKQEVSQKEIPVKLNDGTEIKAVYETINGEKKFKFISPVESTVPYSISPSEKAILIFDSKVQTMLYVDVEGNISDITKQEYVTSGNQKSTFKREEVLQQNPEYIWGSNPVFIDEDNAAYTSNLPWFGKTTKYIWIVNVKNKTYKYINTIYGEDIKFGKASEKGLETTIDNKVVFLKSDGSVQSN